WWLRRRADQAQAAARTSACPTPLDTARRLFHHTTLHSVARPTPVNLPAKNAATSQMVVGAQPFGLDRRQRIARRKEAARRLKCLAELRQVGRIAAWAFNRRAWRRAGLAAERIARARHHALHCANE